MRHLFPLLLGHDVAAHEFAGALDGGEGRAYFMPDEMHGLLIAGFVTLGCHHPLADHEVLISGRHSRRKHRREERRRSRQHDVSGKANIGRKTRRGRDGRADPIRPPRERRSHPDHQQQADDDTGRRRRINQKAAAGQCLEDIGMDLDAGHFGVAHVGSLAAVAGGLRRYSHEHRLARELLRQGGLGPQFCEGDLRNRFVRRAIANAQHAVEGGVCRRRYDDAVNFQIALRFHGRFAGGHTIHFESQRPAALMSCGLFELDSAADRIGFDVDVAFGGRALAELRQRILPLSGDQLARQDHVGRVADGRGETLVVVFVSIVGQEYVDRDGFGPRGGDALQSFRQRFAEIGDASGDAERFLVDRQQDGLRLPVRRSV